MRHKQSHKYSDSSFDSDSCNYSYDDAENGVAEHRSHAKKQQEKDKSKSFNETEAQNNLRKDDEDQSVSDDSLEVIVVKRSLEKKCEKVVSGRKSKIPRECTKETKLTKTHKRSSKKTSRSSKSRTFDRDENTVDRDESSDKEKKSVTVGEPVHTSAEEEEDDSERLIESRYRRDVTDSTSQETVERVIVTAMVHKDQMSDTPRSTQETAKEMSSDGVLRKTTIVIEETKETKDISSSDKSKIALSHKTNTRDTSEERLQRITQESSQINEEAQDKKDKIIMPISMEDGKEGTNSKMQSKRI